MPDSRIDIDVLFREQGLSDIQRNFQKTLNSAADQANRISPQLANRLTSEVIARGEKPQIESAQQLRYALAGVAQEREGLEDRLEEAKRRFGAWAGERHIINVSANLSNLEDEIKRQLASVEGWLNRIQLKNQIIPQMQTQKEMIESSTGMNLDTKSAEESASVFTQRLTSFERAEKQKTSIAEKEAEKQTVTLIRQTDIQERTAARDNQRRIRESEQEATQQQKAESTSAKARIADYNSWLDQQQKLEAGVFKQERQAEMLAHRGVYTAQPNETIITPAHVARLPDYGTQRRVEGERLARQQEQIAQREMRVEQGTYEKALKENVQFDRAKQREYRQALKENVEFDRISNITYRQAQRENKEFEQLRYRGYYTATEEDQRYGDINQQDILRRMPSARDARAFYAELNAEESARSGGRFSKIFGGLNRQGALEGQAAVINTVQALASGMDPAHVAIMESTQLAGAAVQGGLVSLQQIMSAILSPIGAVVGAFGALAGILGTLAAQGYRAGEAIRATQGSLAARGFGQEPIASMAALRGERESLSNRFGPVVSSSSINTITSAFNTAAPETQGFRKRLEELTVAYAAQERVDYETAAKVIGGAAEKGVEGFIGLSRQLNIGSEAWREGVQRLADSENRPQGFEKVLGAVEGRFTPGQAAIQTGPAWFPNLQKYIDAWEKGSLTDFTSIAFTGVGRVDPTRATPQMSSEERAVANLGARFTPEEKDRLAIQSEYNRLKEAELQITQQIKAVEAGGGRADEGLIKSVERAREALQNIAAMEEPRGVADENQRRVNIAELDRQIQEANVEAQADPAAGNRVIALERQKYVSISENAQNVLTRTGDIPSRTTPEMVQQEEKIEQEIRAQQRRTLETQLFQIQRTQTEQHFDTTAQREAAEKRLATIQASSVRDIQEVRNAELQVIQAKQQETIAAENVNSTLIQQQGILAEARGDLEGILQTHRQINQVIQNSNVRTPLEQAQSTTQLRRTEVQIGQRALGREMTVAELGRAQNPADLTAQRVSLENDLNRLLQSGLSTEEQRLQKLGEIVRARHAEVMEAENLRLGEMRGQEALAQARGELDKIVQLRREAAAVIRANPLNSEEKKQAADLAVTQSELTSLERSNHLRKQAIDIQNSAASGRLGTQKAVIDLSVERGDIPRQSAIQLEQQLTQQVLKEQQTRIQNELSNDTLNYDQKAQLFAQLGQLYQQDLQTQLQLQRQLTQAIEAENERRIKHVREFFKTVESGIEDSFAGVLSGKKTFAEAMKDLRTSMISSAAKGIFGMLSEAAGKSLAPSLGVKLKEGEDSSISNVLSKAVGAALGLTKEPPKTDVERIRDLSEKASNAQQEAARLLSDAARDLKAAAGNIGTRQINTAAPEATLPQSDVVDDNGRVKPGVVEEIRKPKAPNDTVDEDGKLLVPVQQAIGTTSTTSTGDFYTNISKAEGTFKNGAIDYNAVYGNGRFGTPPKPFDQMTLTEVNQFGKQFGPRTGVNTSAMGAFQIQARSTMLDAANDLGMDLNTTKFTPETQRKMANWIRQNQGFGAWEGFKSHPEELAAAKEAVSIPSVPVVNVPQQLANPVSGDYSGGSNVATPGTVASKMPNINDIGAPGGPKGMDYIFGKTIPRPEVDASGNITKYSVDPKQAEADKIIADWEKQKSETAKPPEPEKRAEVDSQKSWLSYLNPIGSAQAAEPVSQQKTVGDILQQGAPRYKEITSGRDLMQDFQTSWGHPYMEMSTALKIKEAYDDPQIKPLMNQAGEAINAARPGFNFKESFMSGQPSIDELLKIPARDSNKEQVATSEPIKVDPNSIAQGVAQGQQQVNNQQSASNTLQQSNQSLTQEQQQVQSTIQQNNQEVQQGSTNTQQNTSATEQNSQQIQQLNQNIQTLSQTQQSQQQQQTTQVGNTFTNTGDQNFSSASSNIDRTDISGRSSTSALSNTIANTNDNSEIKNSQINRQQQVVSDTNNSLSQLQTSATQASQSLSSTSQSAVNIQSSMDVAGGSAVTAGSGMQTGGSSATRMAGNLDQAGQSAAQVGQQFQQVGSQGSVGGGGQSGSGLLGGIGQFASMSTALASLLGVKMPATVSKITSGISLLSSVMGMFGSGGGSSGGGGGGMLGGIGSIFGLLTKGISLFAAPFTGGFSLLGGLLGFEKGGIIPSAIASAAYGSIVANDNVIPSAADGFRVQESSLSSSIRMGVRQLSQTNNAVFSTGKLIPNTQGSTGVSDGKGGRLIIAHPGEMVVPANETREILHNIAAGTIPSAAQGTIVSPNVPISSAAMGIIIPGAVRLGQTNVVTPRNVSVPSVMSSGTESRITSGQNVHTANNNLREEILSVANGGDTHNHNYQLIISSIDSRSGAQFLMNHADEIVSALATKRRSFDSRGR